MVCPRPRSLVAEHLGLLAFEQGDYLRPCPAEESLRSSGNWATGVDRHFLNNLADDSARATPPPEECTRKLGDVGNWGTVWIAIR